MKCDYWLTTATSLLLTTVAQAAPTAGVAMQYDHLSFIRSAQTSSANMITGVVEASFSQWLGIEGRLSVNATNLIADYPVDPGPGQTKLDAQAGTYLRASLPLDRYVQVYALAGLNYMSLTRSECAYVNSAVNPSLYQTQCAQVRRSEQGLTYGGGLRIGTSQQGWVRLEALHFAKHADGFGFTSWGFGGGINF